MNNHDSRDSYQHNRSVYETPRRRPTKTHENTHQDEYGTPNLMKSPRMSPYGNTSPETKACSKISTRSQKKKTFGKNHQGKTNDLREELERIKQDLKKQEKYTEALMRQTIGSNCSIDTVYSDESIVDVNFYCSQKDSLNKTSECNSDAKARIQASSQCTPRPAIPYTPQIVPECTKCSGRRENKFSEDKSPDVMRNERNEPHQCKPRSAIPFMPQSVPQCTKHSDKRKNVFTEEKSGDTMRSKENECRNETSKSLQCTPRSAVPYTPEPVPQCHRCSSETGTIFTEQKPANASTPNQCKPRSAIPYMPQTIPQCTKRSDKRKNTFTEEKSGDTMRSEENECRNEISTPLQCAPRSAVPYTPEPVPQCNRCSGNIETKFTEQKPANASTPNQCKPRSAIPYMPQTVPQCNKRSGRKGTKLSNECLPNRTQKAATEQFQIQDSESHQCVPRSAVPYTPQPVPQCSKCGHKRGSNYSNGTTPNESHKKRKGYRRSKSVSSDTELQQFQSETSDLNAASSFCIHCLNKGHPVIRNSLVSKVQKLIGNHNKADIIITVTLQTNGLYHMNLSLKPHGDYLGCLYSNKEAIMEANKAKEFKQYLKIFVASDPNTADAHKHLFDIHFTRFKKE